MKNWNDKMAHNDLTVGILGLGYVGLPLAREFASANISTLGFDIDARKVKVLNSGKSIIKNVPQCEVKQIVSSGCFSATSDMSRIVEVDAVLICVPTPLTENREPNMHYVISSCEKIVKA